MKKFVLYYIFFASFTLNSQKPTLISFNQTSISYGLNFGSRTNLLNDHLNMYLSVNTSLMVKNLPFNFTGRISSEKYISGRPSYFRVSYDGYKNQKLKAEELLVNSSQLEKLINQYTDSVHFFESKLAYLYKIKSEKNIPAKTNVNINGVHVKNPDINLQNINSIDQVNLAKYNDSLNMIVDKYQNELKQINQNISELKDQNEKVKLKISQINNHLPKSFLLGVEKLDFGLTTLSSSSISNNAIPIQGVRLKGEFYNYFYDLAFGLTVPNRIFSTSIYDQLMNNTQNIFNINQYYTVNTTRIVSSTIIGYGKKSKNSVSIENYYNGPEFNFIKNQNKKVLSSNMTTNVSGTWSPINNLNTSFTFGKTFQLNKTSSSRFLNDVAFSGSAKYFIWKKKINFFTEVKRVGNQYDGYSQGIYNSGFTKVDIGFTSKIWRVLDLTLMYQNQKFNVESNTFSGLKTESGIINLQYRVTRNLVLYGGYTLLNASGNDSLANGICHLEKSGFNYIRKLKSFRIEFKGFNAVSIISRNEKNLNTIFSNLDYDMDWKYLGFSVQMEYQQLAGLGNLYGTNWIFKPELKIHTSNLNLITGLQLMESEQFGFQKGLYFNFNFKPSNYFTWDIMFMKWLPNQTIYIPNFESGRSLPYFFELKMSLLLNKKKR